MLNVEKTESGLQVYSFFSFHTIRFSKIRLMQPFIYTWLIYNRINLYLLNAIEETHSNDVSASKGRSVGEQFAHIHNVWLMWLKATASDLLGGLFELEKGAITQELLAIELEKSAQAMGKLLLAGF